MNYKYDSWGRITDIGYPDNEGVHYHYNSAGDLYAMTGSKWSSTVGTENFRYIDSIKYNKYGQKTAIYYGNGTRAHYSYDNLQRLQYLNSYTAGDNSMQNIAYSYDATSHITSVSNSAQPLANGLGGSYSNSYTYDDLYRLVHSEGNSGSHYTLDMEYSPNGKILQKTQTALYSLNGANHSATTQYDYNYIRGTNQLEKINQGCLSATSVVSVFPRRGDEFKWDANGNLLMHSIKCSERWHCWDEENRLMALKDNRQFGYYLYDAGGERTYKLNGKMGKENINGQWYGQPGAGNVTLYASPYLVATPQGYTKHYYAGNDRIASKIGGGRLANINEPVGDWKKKQEQWRKIYKDFWMNCLTSLEPKMYETAKLHNLYNLKYVQSQETESYFYHPDHLGSSSWITNTQGNAIQHLQYLPFGEPRVDQRTTAWNTMYTFSGKERDEESSYSYFGARYYDSDISIWLSVDPRASSYPSVTPYNYCMNSPVMYRDPNGESIKWWQGLLIGLGVDALTGGAVSATAMFAIGTAIGTTGVLLTPGSISATAFAAGVSGLTVAGAVAGVGLGNAVANTAFALIGSAYGGDIGDRVGNAWKLYAGMFKTDKNLNFFQRYWQFMSRYTYEMPITAFGQAWNGGANAFSSGEVNVGYFHGATVLQTEWMGSGGVTIGSNITIGYADGGIDANNPTLLHEYGHYLQTRAYGNMAWYNMAFSSLTTPANKHKENWTEQDANYRSMRYFQNKITTEQYDNFLTDPYYSGYFQSYSYRLLLGYFMPLEIFTDLFWRK